MVGFPNNSLVSPTKSDHFGVFFLGYHHLRKHPETNHDIPLGGSLVFPTHRFQWEFILPTTKRRFFIFPKGCVFSAPKKWTAPKKMGQTLPDGRPEIAIGYLQNKTSRFSQQLTVEKRYAGWWLNQPIWKIWTSSWIHLPQIVYENKKYLSCHHLDMEKTPSLASFSATGSRTVPWEKFWTRWNLTQPVHHLPILGEKKFPLVILLMEEILHHLLGRYFIPLFTGLYTSQVVQDFFHEPNFIRVPPGFFLTLVVERPRLQSYKKAALSRHHSKPRSLTDVGWRLGGPAPRSRAPQRPSR